MENIQRQRAIELNKISKERQLDKKRQLENAKWKTLYFLDMNVNWVFEKISHDSFIAHDITIIEFRINSDDLDSMKSKLTKGQFIFDSIEESYKYLRENSKRYLTVVTLYMRGLKFECREGDLFENFRFYSEYEKFDMTSFNIEDYSELDPYDVNILCNGWINHMNRSSFKWFYYKY